MQEQNFEKQVQHKLEELSLTPSVPVWQKVEKEIREKKKRRRLIVFWLFPILIGTGMFWGLQTLTDKNDSQVSKVDLPNTPVESKQPINSTDKQSVTAKPTEQTVSTSITRDPSSTETIQKPSTVSSTNNASTPTSPAKSTLITSEKSYNTNPSKNQNDESFFVTNTKKKFSPARPQKQKNPISIVPDEALLLTSTSEPTQNVITNDRITEIKSSKESDFIMKDQPLQQLITIKEEIKPTIISDSIQNKKGHPKVPKWSWVAQASYGIASLQTDFLSKAFSTPQAFSDPLLNSGFPASSPPPTAMQVSPRVENGPAFHVSIGVKRNANKRFSATAALQYSYLSVKNSVGQTVQRDTMVFYTAENKRVLNQFYRPAQTGTQLQEYVNKYHFIELPVGIEWQLQRRFPLHIQTGLSLSYLFKTNALVYDPNARIYYQNNELFSKMQLQFFSGITYRVFKHKNLGIHAGPYLQYGLTNLEKENKNHHLLSTGLKAALSF